MEPIILKLRKDEIGILTTELCLPREHLSPNSMGMYLRCGMQFKKRYHEGKKQPPAATLVEGTTHHKTLEKNNSHKMKRGNDLPAKTLVQHFCDTFSTNKKEIEDWGDTTEKQIIDRGKILQTKYHDKFAPRLKPKFIEQEVRFILGGVQILGYIDVGGMLKNALTMKSKKTVIDYKTTKRKKSKEELENAISLTLYGMWSNNQGKKNLSDVGFCLLKKTTVPEIEWQNAQMNIGRILWFRRMVLSVADSISRGSFPLCDSTMNYLCNEKWCGYWHECKGRCVGWDGRK